MAKTKVTYEPPRCPDCGANLFKVAENDVKTYTFNPETGRYTEDGWLEMKCLDCGADLSDVFPHGVCNYPTIERTERGK